MEILKQSLDLEGTEVELTDDELELVCGGGVFVSGNINGGD